MDEKVFFEKALLEAMNAYHVPVTAYAVINDFEINQSNTLSIDSTISTTQESLFQVASISKVLTSLGILKLVEKDLIKLDNPANDYLTDWKIPENQFNKNNPVLVRQLLDMTSGLSISNFDGYPQNKTLPTPLELLNGNAPANNVPVEVLHQPGSDYAYSNGGFQVLQKITEELTGRSFSDYQNNEIIKALDMKNSLFEFPLNANLVSHAVPAFVGDKKIEPGGWHNFAALASCGMWSTPVDIAKLILNITHAYLGKKPAFLSKAMTTAMLTRQQFYFRCWFIFQPISCTK